MKGNRLNDRVAYLLIRADKSLLFALPDLQAERDDLAMSPLIIESVDRPMSTIASAFTGAKSLRHGAFTQFVPDLESESSDDRPRLRPRSSRDFGAPLLNHRLYGRGIASLTVGLPLAPAESEESSLLTEVPLAAVRKKAKEENVDMLTSTFGFLLGGVAKNPEVRCLMATLNMIRKQKDSAVKSVDPDPDPDPDGDGEGEGEDSTSEESVSADQKKKGIDSARQLLTAIDALREAADVTHVYAVVVTRKMGTGVLFGPRSDELDASFVQMESGAGITLALLGEDVPADVAGGKLLQRNEGHAASWAVDSVELTPVDWEGAFEYVREGHAKEMEVAMTVNHFRGRLRAAVMMADREEAIRVATRLNVIEPSRSNLLGLAILQGQSGEVDECRASVRKIQAEHPDTVESDLAELIPALGTDPQRVGEILDRYEYPMGSNILIRQLWTRALVSAGRVDDAIDANWKLISQKAASMYDRIVFARLSMDRSRAGDAGRAALVLRMVTPRAPLNKNGEPKSGPLILRARALHASGHGKMAVMLLKKLLVFHPMEQKATAALNEIQRNLAGSGT